MTVDEARKIVADFDENQGITDEELRRHWKIVRDTTLRSQM